MADFKLITTAFAHPHLRRFILTSSLSTCPSPLPTSNSLQCIVVPNFNLSTVIECLPQARSLHIGSLDYSIRENLICPHLHILHLCMNGMKAIDVCCLFNSNLFPSLRKIILDGDINRGTEMTLFEFSKTFFSLLAKFNKVTLTISISAYRMYADPTQDKFRELVDIESKDKSWKKLKFTIGSEFPRLWYDLEGLREKI